MSGLAQLIPYFECQYPQVVPFTNQQAAAVVNSQGMGDYLQNFGFPIPQYLSPGNTRGLGDYLQNFGFPIPQYLSPGNMRGLGCAECGGTCNGLGQGTITIGSTQIALSSPGGYFASGSDFSQWGLEEWGTVAGVFYILKSIVSDTKRQVRKVRKAGKAYRSTK